MSTASIRTHRSNNPALLAWEEAYSAREAELERKHRRHRELITDAVDRAETLQFAAAERFASQALGQEILLFGKTLPETHALFRALGLPRQTEPEE